MAFMIDLETLDTEPSSMVLSIGIVEFDLLSKEIIGKTYHKGLDLKSQFKKVELFHLKP